MASTWLLCLCLTTRRPFTPRAIVATREVVGMDNDSGARGRAGRKPDRGVTREFVDVYADLEVSVLCVSLERAGRKAEG